MSRRTRNLLIILAAVGILVYGGFLAYRYFFTFYMTGTTPRTSAVLSFTPYIDVNFNKKPLQYDEFLVTSNSPEILQKIEFRETSIRIFLESMTLDSDYTLRFDPIRSEGGDEIRNLTLEFTAKAGNFEDLSAEQQQYILEEQDRQPETLSDPILQHLPYSTLNFELSPLLTENDERKSVLVLEARLLLTAADVRINADAATKRYKQEVVDYIRSLDFKPEDYTIRYEVVEPTL